MVVTIDDFDYTEPVWEYPDKIVRLDVDGLTLVYCRKAGFKTARKGLPFIVQKHEYLGEETVILNEEMVTGSAYRIEVSKLHEPTRWATKTRRL